MITSEDFYRPASYIEYEALKTLCQAGVQRVYLLFDWTEYGEQKMQKLADKFKPSRKTWEAIGLVWNYLEENLREGIDVLIEPYVFSGDMGIEFSDGFASGYFRGWMYLKDRKKEKPIVEFQQKIKPATEVEELLWEAA